MPKLSIVIPDGESPFASHVITCLLQAKKLSVHLVSRTPAPLARFSRKVKSFHFLRDGQSLADAVMEVCSKQKIDLCMPVDMDAIYYFAQRRKQVEAIVPFLLMDSAQNLRTFWDKGLLAAFLAENRLPAPVTIRSYEQFNGRDHGLIFPVLVKPRLSGGGVGIVRFEDRIALSREIEEKPDFFDNYIVQNFLEGEDIDCSVLCKNGEILAHTIQKGIKGSEVREGFQSPDAIEFVHDPDVLQAVTKLVSTFKWTGVAHIDLRKRASDGRVVIIEVNPRFWGSLEGSFRAGVNFPHLAIKASLGETFPKAEYHDVRYASAISVVRNKLAGRSTVNLFSETNLWLYIQNPLMALARMAGYK